MSNVIPLSCPPLADPFEDLATTLQRIWGLTWDLSYPYAQAKSRLLTERQNTKPSWWRTCFGEISKTELEFRTLVWETCDLVEPSLDRIRALYGQELWWHFLKQQSKLRAVLLQEKLDNTDAIQKALLGFLYETRMCQKYHR